MDDKKQRKRRFRSPHPGVKIRKRDWPKTGLTSYSAIFTDPDTGRQHSVSLTELGLSNEEQRKQWAIKKSREIQRRKEELELGAPRRSQTEIDKAVDRFLDDKRMETRAKTMEVYGEALARFKHWARLAKLTIVEHLAPQHLAHLRTHLIGLPKRDAVKGGKRGQRHDGAERRSPYSINRDIRSIKTLLNYWRRRDLTPLLNSDHLTDRLQLVKEPKKLKTFLMQDDLAKLLQACLRHDAEKFSETRQEHAGFAPVGSTPRYFPVTPFLLTVLLTGCRVGEVRGLRWDQVFLDQKYIALGDPEEIKTGMGRRITLAESPLLAVMLAAMKLRALDDTYVFGGKAELSEELADNCRSRLIKNYGAPAFTWQELRRTCGTFLMCSPGIRGENAAWLAAARLGHSLEVAQRHYWGVLTNVPAVAKTLEAAMGIEAIVRSYIQETYKISLGDDEAGGGLRMYR